MPRKAEQKEVIVKKHEPRPGRMAFICMHKDHKVPPRVFSPPGSDTPRCSEHGTMKRQSNNAYLGQQVPS